MPPDHYDTLGVPRDADAAAIKRAHRAAARRHHPDTPDGDREQFEAAQRAYLVLSDPDLRAKYDRGEDPTAGPDNRQAIVMQLAIKAFMEAAAGGETRHDDFIAAARRALEHDSDMATQALDKLHRERSKWQEVADRVSRDEAAGPNFLAQSINAQIAGIDEDTRRISERLGQLRDAIEALEGFAYRVDERFAQPHDPWAEMQRAAREYHDGQIGELLFGSGARRPNNPFRSGGI